MRTRPPRLVYAIDDGRYTKVGVGHHPERRLRTMQTGNARELELLGTWPGGAALEQYLHRQFDTLGRRVRGEWFDLRAELEWCYYADNVADLIELEVAGWGNR